MRNYRYFDFSTILKYGFKVPDDIIGMILMLTFIEGLFSDDYGYNIPVEYLADAFYDILDSQYPNLDFEFIDELPVASQNDVFLLSLSLLLKISVIYLAIK